MQAIFVAVLALAAVAAAMPQQFPLLEQAKPVVPVLSRTEVRDDFNQHALSYVSGDGAAVAQHLSLKPVQDGEYKGHYVPAQMGSYQYTSPEGRVVKVTYTADENGFQPISDAIPVAPVA